MWPMRTLAITGNRNDVHDAFDKCGVAHARDPAFAANIGRYFFEGHDGNGAGFLGDHGLLGRNNVHNNAALEHLRQTTLNNYGPDLLFHVHPRLSKQVTNLRDSTPAVLGDSDTLPETR